jgi:hypothetical protein
MAFSFSPIAEESTGQWSNEGRTIGKGCFSYLGRFTLPERINPLEISHVEMHG